MVEAILFASLATGNLRALRVFMVEAQSYADESNALFVPLLAVATLATVAPVVLSALMRAWTSIMRTGVGTSGIWRGIPRATACPSAPRWKRHRGRPDLLAGVARSATCWRSTAQQQGLLDYKTRSISPRPSSCSERLSCAPSGRGQRGHDVEIAHPRRPARCRRRSASNAAGRGRVRSLHPCRHGNAGGMVLAVSNVVTAAAVGMPPFSMGWLERVWPFRSRASSSSSPRRSCPRSPPFAKEPATVLAMGE